MSKLKDREIKTAYDIQTKANIFFRPFHQRVESIKKLTKWIKSNEDEIKTSIKLDFKKPDIEIELTEIWICIKEADLIIKNLKKWMKPKKIAKTLTLITTKSYIQKNPKGKILIMSPWNYPFQLTIMPLLAAIAAGNSVFLKPSEKTPNVSNLIKKMASEIFSPKDVVVFEGGKDTVNTLLKHDFDHIMYTGGIEVGQLIMQKAAKTLTPVTLELGGKCPVLVDKDVNLDRAAQKIIYYKFMNAGQTCVAPDYILVDSSVYDEFKAYCVKYIKRMYGDSELIKNNPDYCRIVNNEHFERLFNKLEESLNSGDKVIFGGDYDSKKSYFSPTLISSKMSSHIMKEEIFGPILPIIQVEQIEDAIENINSKDAPLAAYIFTNNKSKVNYFIGNVKSGAICINDLTLHLVHSHLPFGGVGKSGIGRYHGKFGFDEFSNEIPILKNINNSPLMLLYPPYTKRVRKIVNLVRKLF